MDRWRKRRGATTPGMHRDGPLRIFTDGEKRGLLVGHVFQGAKLDGVDFSAADMRAARFVDTSLRDCDFSAADLRGAHFLRCDLRGARFPHAQLENNWFGESWFVGAIGLSKMQRKYIEQRRGSFMRIVEDSSGTHDHADSPQTPSTKWEKTKD